MFNKLQAISKRRCVGQRKLFVSLRRSYNSKRYNSKRYDFKSYDQVELLDVVLNMNNGLHYRIFDKHKGYELYENSDKQNCELYDEHMRGEKVNNTNKKPKKYKKCSGYLIPKKYNNICIFKNGIIPIGFQYLALDPTKPKYYYWTDKLNIGDITVDDSHHAFLVEDFIHSKTIDLSYDGGGDYDNSYFQLVKLDHNQKPIAKEKRKLHYGDAFNRSILVYKYPVLLPDDNLN